MGADIAAEPGSACTEDPDLTRVRVRRLDAEHVHAVLDLAEFRIDT